MKAYKGGKTSGGKEHTDPRYLKAIKNQTKGEIIFAENVAEHKYSAMLLELIRPYQSERPGIDEVDSLLQLAFNAWNIANLKKELPPAYNLLIQGIRQDLKGNKEAIKLLNKLINDKEKKFAADQLYVLEYELRPGKGDNANLTTRAGSLEAFLAASLLDEEEEDTYNYEPAYINRTAVLVKVREPFIAWLKEIDDSISLDDDLLEANIYLIEIKETTKAEKAWLKKNFDRIFTKELEEWYVDESLWPKNRTYEMLKDWFELSIISSVYDLEHFPIDKDLL